MILKFCFLYLSYKYLYLKARFLRAFFKDFKTISYHILVHPQVYTTNHITSDPSYDWYFLGLSYYIPSERSYICACVFFRSGRAFVFPILFMIIYFSYFCCLSISVFYGSSYCLPKSPFCACQFILELMWTQTCPVSASHFHALSLSPKL